VWTEAAPTQAKAHSPGGERNRAADFDQEFSPVQQVNLAVRELSIREHTVDEHENERGKDQVMKFSPQWASYAQAHD
jgi:hypothetical protein